MKKSSTKNEQQLKEGFSEELSSKNHNATTPDLKKEFEEDDHGNINAVDRARYANQDSKNNEGSKVAYPTKSIYQTTKTAEHQDFNSNSNPDEFPDKNKKNKENHGNIAE